MYVSLYIEIIKNRCTLDWGHCVRECVGRQCKLCNRFKLYGGQVSCKTWIFMSELAACKGVTQTLRKLSFFMETMPHKLSERTTDVKILK